MGVQCCGGGHPIWCDSLPTLPVDPAHVEGRGVVRVVHISPWPLVEAGSGGGLVRQSGAETMYKGRLTRRVPLPSGWPSALGLRGARRSEECSVTRWIKVRSRLAASPRGDVHRGESGCSPGARWQEVPDIASGDQVIHVYLFVPIDGKAQRMKHKRSRRYSRVQESHCARAGFDDSRRSARVACFLKYDLPEGHLIHRELRSMLDSGYG